MRRLLLAAMLAVVVSIPFGLRADDNTSKPSAPTSSARLLDKQILDLAAEGPQAISNLTFMCDQIGARLTGTANLKRANDWAAGVMRKYGLENVHLEPWEVPIGWQRGLAEARMVEPNTGHRLTLAAMAWTGSTPGKITCDVVVLTARTTAELAKYKGKLKGAVVLRGAPSRVRPITDMSFPLPGGQPRRRGQGGPGGQPPADGRPRAGGAQPVPRPDFQARRAMMRQMTEFLRNEGVAAVLTDSGKPHGLLNMTGSWRGTERAGAGEPLPTLFVAHEDYSMLYRLATRKDGAKTRIELEVKNTFVPGPITVYNTVGEIRGSEKPDEFVIVGAHLDSWDLAQGATDNGTGTVIVLEAARVLAKCGVRPKRTIRFVLFTGEEEGLYGSREYVKRHKDELPKISMALVHDTGTGKVIGLGLQGREAIKPILEAEVGEVLKPLGFTQIDLRGMGGTDHLSFEAAGVPGFACRQDMDEYRLTHHSQSDTLDKAKGPNLTQGAQVMAVIAMHVANLPELLPRTRPAGAASRFGGGFGPPPTPPAKPKPPR